MFVGVLFLLFSLLLAREWRSPGTVKGTQSQHITRSSGKTPGAVTKQDDCWVFMHMPGSGALDTGIRSVLLDNWRGKNILFDTVQWRRGDEYTADLVSSRCGATNQR